MHITAQSAVNGNSFKHTLHSKTSTKDPTEQIRHARLTGFKADFLSSN